MSWRRFHDPAFSISPWGLAISWKALRWILLAAVAISQYEVVWSIGVQISHSLP